MKKRFKYDYKNEKRNICIVVMIYLIALNLLICSEDVVLGLLLGLSSVFLLILATMSYSKKGITIDYEKRYVVVRDDMGRHIFPFERIEMVSLQEIKKENKGKNAFSTFFVGAKEETSVYDYVYNKGRTFNIIFRIKNQSGYGIYKSYFGWMFKEKNELVIEESLSKLNNIIDEINMLKMSKTK